MGMSSSQARLLSLTSRQHDVEWRAQKLQAEKLQLANDSDRVYNTYLAALSSTKIQARVYDQWEGDTFKDATLAMLENGVIPEGKPGYDGTKEYASQPLFLQEISTGRLMITPEYAASIGVTATDDRYTGTLDDFLTNKFGDTHKTEITEVRPTDPATWPEDPDKVTSFTAVGNKKVTPYSYNYSYNPVSNINGGVNYDALKKYADFDSAHKTVSGPSVSSVTSFTSGQTYTINNTADLQKLLTLSATNSTAGVNFVMTTNISLSGINWTGIKNFQGNFDGNGYKVTDLQGSQGLFDSTNGANIKNVGLENINVNGNSAYIGGLIGSATNTNIENAYTTGKVTNLNNTNHSDLTSSSSNVGTGGLVGYMNYTLEGPSGNNGSYTINNIFSNVDVTGHDNVGGLLGSYSSRNSDPNISNAYAIGNVSGNNNVGGFAGHMYNDQDTRNKNTDISNVYTGGNVTGNDKVGGFFGNYLYWGDLGDHCEINGCMSSGKVNGATSNEGAFAGHIYIKLTNGASGENRYVNFVDCGYANNTGAANGYGNIVDTSGNNVNDLVNQSGSGAGLVEFEAAEEIPSIKADGTGGFYSNIYGALVKAGAFDPKTATEEEKNQLDSQIKSFIQKFGDNDVDNEKLYHLNNKLYSYLTGADDTAFTNALISDITNGTNTATAGYQTGAAPGGKIKRSTTDDAWEPVFNESMGEIEIPNIKTIRQNLISATKMAGAGFSEDQIDVFLAKYNTGNKQDLAYLAELNDRLYKYSQGTINSIGEIITCINSNNKFQEMPSIIDDLDHYTITMNGTDESGRVTETHPKLPQTETIVKREWDWDDPDVQQAVAEYNMLKGGFIIIGDTTVSEDYDGVGMHNSADWLTNVIQGGIAQFVTYNHEDGTVIGTSVANEVSLQEVQNTTYISAAEATYERDMKKINKKETKIDTDLQKLEAERTSIKTEQDDLKKVIQDNVDLTFKLFS